VKGSGLGLGFGSRVRVRVRWYQWHFLLPSISLHLHYVPLCPVGTNWGGLRLRVKTVWRGELGHERMEERVGGGKEINI
jgi:hypothetical protein